MKLYSHFSANNILLMNFPFKMELAMESYLLENPEVLKLNDTDDIPQVHSLEVPWKRDKTDGRIDLLVSYNGDTLAVLELKNGILTRNHFEQLNDYFKDKDYLENATKLVSEKKDWDWLGVLVGTEIDSDLLSDITNNKRLVHDIPFGVIVINRYKGENQFFITTDVYPPKSGRDYTKYFFNGESYPKGRLVWAFIQHYVDMHPDVDIFTLRKLIPQVYSGKPVVEDFDKAVVLSNRQNKNGNSYNYYFTKPTEAVILMNDVKLAVMSSWTKDDMKDIKEIAKSLGCEFTPEK